MPRTKLLIWPLILISLFMARGEAAEDPGISDIEATRCLQRMTAFYTRLDHIRLEVVLSFSAGQNKKLDSTYQIAISKPNKIAIAVKEGLGISVISDGKTLVTYQSTLNIFTKSEAPATMEALFVGEKLTPLNPGVNDVRSLGTAMYDIMVEGACIAKDRGLETESGTILRHLSIQYKNLSWDLWLDEGPQPLIRKLAVNLSKQNESTANTAKTELALTCGKWNVTDPAPEDAFKITLPSNATQLDSILDSIKTLTGK